jgi:hypothetical protein
MTLSTFKFEFAFEPVASTKGPGNYLWALGLNGSDKVGSRITDEGFTDD